MSIIENIAKIDSKFRPIVNSISPAFAVKLYSNSRNTFLKNFNNEKPSKSIRPELSTIKLWNLEFNCSLFNSAGMFKNGEGYHVCAMQGAGAFLSGTTTAKPRKGNIKNGAKAPLAPYPLSGAALNWMGLPNIGHEPVAKELSKINKIKSCPVGASLSTDPGIPDIDAMPGLILGLNLYEKANVDFIEINESCPNVEHTDTEFDESGLHKNLIARLEKISSDYIKKSEKKIPLIVKFSNDTDVEQIPALIDLLLDMGFSGINLGNTSTKYDLHRSKIVDKELKNYDYFINNFGGGLSGKPLKENSLILVKAAQEVISTKNLKEEFHVIRTGGIESKQDLQKSYEAGIALNQWYTGYFEAFAKHGHKLYKEMY